MSRLLMAPSKWDSDVDAIRTHRLQEQIDDWELDIDCLEADMRLGYQRANEAKRKGDVGICMKHRLRPHSKKTLIRSYHI
ncbi:hypothetical protein PanWU01x14_171870 [Parasponia andersonii]|uniref:Uncharacterized protein n=1 Tax=Parasponia andersonii TaxID=3476 RepID=A0A2P5C9B0_PARAD|nr:hypothetical protein PanWU01x14_171870 [Parasponia andersonii]